MITLNPGMVVAIRGWWGEHWGIVAADKYGQLTVISNRGLRGCVTEELWHSVVGTSEWHIVKELASDIPGYFVVERARSMIGSRYDFLKWNCQDLVYWALGLEPQSPQREMVVGLISLACMGVIVRVAAKSG